MVESFHQIDSPKAPYSMYFDQMAKSNRGTYAQTGLKDDCTFILMIILKADVARSRFGGYHIIIGILILEVEAKSKLLVVNPYTISSGISVIFRP